MTRSTTQSSVLEFKNKTQNEITVTVHVRAKVAVKLDNFRKRKTWQLASQRIPAQLQDRDFFQIAKRLWDRAVKVVAMNLKRHQIGQLAC